MDILITGGTGAIGAWVTREVWERGHRPVVYDINPSMTMLKDLTGEITVIKGDILDWGQLIRTLKQERIQRVIHLASLIEPAVGSKVQSSPKRQLDVSVIGLYNVLEAARFLELERVVYMSSKAAIGLVEPDNGYPQYKPITEDYRLMPTEVYGGCKVLGEQLGNAYSNGFGLDFVAIRLAVGYGPGKVITHGKAGLLGKVIENAMLGRDVIFAHGGDEQLDIIYNRDVAQGITLACLKDGHHSKLYHLGTGKAASFRDLAVEVSKQYPGVRYEIGGGLDPMDIGARYCVMDISRAKNELGYEPQYDLEKGVADYIQALEKFDIKPVYTP